MAPPLLMLRPKSQRRPEIATNRPKKPVGRRMMSFAELAKRKQDRRRDLMKSKKESWEPVTTSCPFEQLPVELLQHIFFYSLEVNLARTSRKLRNALSHDTIHRSLLLFAFFDDDGKYPVEVHHFLPAQYRILEIEEKIRLQKSILLTHWCTLGKVEACLPILTRLKMVQERAAEEKRQQPYLEDRKRSRIVSDRPEVADVPALNDDVAMEMHFFANRNEFDIGDNRAVTNPWFPRIIRWDFTLAGNDKIRKSLATSTSVLCVRHIPSNLLTGTPWTENRLRLLQILRQGHRFLQRDFYLDISADAMFQGMANALQENNYAALLTLLELHNATFIQKRVSSDNNWSCSIEYGANVFKQNTNAAPNFRLYASPFSHPLPIELFHIAVQETKDPSLYIAALLREGVDSIPTNDPILTGWALRAADRQDKLGKWLLKHMEGTQTYGLSNPYSPTLASLPPPLFINGELNPLRKEGHYPFPDRTFTAELAYVTHGALPFIPSPASDFDGITTYEEFPQ